VVEEGVRLGSEEWYNAAVRHGKIKMQEPPGTKLKTRWCREFVRFGPSRALDFVRMATRPSLSPGAAVRFGKHKMGKC